MFVMGVFVSFVLCMLLFLLVISSVNVVLLIFVIDFGVCFVVV